MKKKITVLMPVYNGAEFLEQSINSILNQTFVDFEFLIIDDGSTDNSLEIIKKVADKRIKVIENPENMGLVYTLNKGFALANGKYIARMDADDIAYTTRLEKQYIFMENNLEYGVCGTWLKTIEGGKVYNYPVKHENIKASLLFYCALGHPTTMIRTEILRKKNIKYNEVYAEDYDLWVRLSSLTKLYNLPEVLLDYRVHDSVTRFSNQHSNKQYLATKKIREYQLLELGIKKVGTNLDLHHMIGDSNFIYNESFIEKVKLWNEEIEKITGNKKGNYKIISNKIAKAIKEELEEISKILLEIKNREKDYVIYMWGTGQQAEQDFSLLEKYEINIKNFIDNDRKKQGSYFKNRLILSLSDINTQQKSLFIISSMYYESIKKDLQKNGYNNEDVYKLRTKRSFLFY